MMGEVCNLRDFRCRRAWQQALTLPSPAPYVAEAWVLAFKAQSAVLAYWLAMGRFHAQLLPGGQRHSGD